MVMRGILTIRNNPSLIRSALLDPECNAGLSRVHETTATGSSAVHTSDIVVVEVVVVRVVTVVVVVVAAVAY
jgi:hypothetical protein